MNRTIQRITVTAALAVAAIATSAAAASAETAVELPGPKGNCVFVGSVTIGNPLYSPDLVKSDPKTGVYTSNNCPA